MEDQVNRQFDVSASEVQESPVRVSAANLTREIHDLMCSCGKVDMCDTPGVQGTVLEAASTLLAKDEWSMNFEDGWIRVERVAATPPEAAAPSDELYAAAKEVVDYWKSGGYEPGIEERLEAAVEKYKSIAPPSGKQHGNREAEEK